MKHKPRVGTISIIIGVLLIGYASILFLQNSKAELHAMTYSEDIVARLYLEIDEEALEETDITDYEELVVIGEEVYLGVLEIPSLGLTLPVQDTWSYNKLQNTPCAYQLEPLIIAAYNYNAHFGEIGMLVIGDQVKFTYASGDAHYYELVLIEVLHETSVEEMESGDYDLTLFTCNLQDNSERIAARFLEISLD